MSTWAWHAHPDVWVLVAVLTGGYILAVRRLGPVLSAPGEPAVTRAQVAWYSLGVLSLWLGSDWPVHDLAETHLYSVHMVQHLIFTFIAAPFLLLGTPAWLLRALLSPPKLYRVVRAMCRPVVALLVFNALIVVTHWPDFVDWTLGSESRHFLAHAAIFLAALAMWAPVAAPLAEMRCLTPPGQMLYLFLQSVVPTVPASFLVFAEKPIYRFYEGTPRIFSVSVLEDQRIAGLLMKLGGGALLWAIIAVLFFRWHTAEEEADRQDRRWRDLERELDDEMREARP